MYVKVKKWLKNNLPKELIEYYQSGRYYLLHLKNKNRTAAQVFSEVYAKNLWGDSRKHGDFYSGPGSEGMPAEKYVNAINGFIASLKKNNLCVVDLGCGDFRIGKKIAQANHINYMGVDIVPELIERNKNKYQKEHINFLCLDIITGELPDGDICLVREVLQHLSNGEIKKILEKIKKYQYVFITEAQPSVVKSYNKDKPHGQDTRLYGGSGVYLDKSPFCINNANLLVSTQGVEGEEINTFVIKNII